MTTTKEKVMSDNTKESVEQEVAETPEGTIKRLNEELEKKDTQIASLQNRLTVLTQTLARNRHLLAKAVEDLSRVAPKFEFQ